MLPSTVNVVATTLILLLSTTFVNSIAVLIGGKNIFKKAHFNEKSSYYPLANLFTVLDVAEMSSFYGILFFVPIVNIIVMGIMFYKLGGEFNASTIFKVGLAIAPIIFFPLLAFSEKQYKVDDEAYKLKFDNAKEESINLLSDEELREQYKEDEEEQTPAVDSIFKSKVETIETPQKYKATKINLLDDNITTTNEDKKDDNIEMVDL